MKYLVVILILLSISPVFAQSLFDSATIDEIGDNKKSTLDLSGYGRGSSFSGFDKYDFTTTFGEVALQGKVKNGNAFMYADLRVRDGYRFNESYFEFQLKEVYVGYSGEKADVLLGNQIVSWGRTDGFNPTNCITPSDYFFLTGNPDDQLMSNFMFRLKYRLSNQIDFDLITIPVYKASIYRYNLFDFGERVTFEEITLPEQKFENVSFAARLNFEFSKIGFSTSYFRGYNPDFGFDVQNIDWSTGSAVVTNTATPYLKSMIGADLEVPLGSWIVRGEFAYNITTGYKGEMYIPNPDLQYVAGFEHSFNGFTAILQYIGKFTLDFNGLVEPVLSDPTNQMAQLQYANHIIIYESTLFNRKQFYQQKKTNHALALTISKPFNYDTWNVELTGYYNLTSEEYMFRPKISWDISDALTASTGLIYMHGSDKEMFYYASPVMNGAFIELKVNF